MRAADFILELLARAGVDVVFGLPGGTIAPLFDALVERPGMKLVTTSHENAAVFAAAGYAATSGKPGVALVTSGPGVLNALNGLASAQAEGLPVLLLVGEVARSNAGRGALQEGTAHGLDVVHLARGLTKLSEAATSPDALPALLHRALACALSDVRGPVLLTLPIDVTRATLAVPRIGGVPHVRYATDDLAVQRAALALRHSPRAAILAGSGCRTAGPALLRLAEHLQVPVITTPKGKGVFPESHALALGVVGTGGHPSAYRFLEAGVDALLVVGSSLGELATDGWSSLLRPASTFVQVDADAKALGRNYPVDVGIVGRAELVLDDLRRALGAPTATTSTFGIATDPSNELASSRITPPEALCFVQRALPDDTIFASDIGEHLLFATHFLRIERPDAFFVMSGLGSMGSGIGGALGVQCAAPDRRVVVVCGDGGLLMSLGDVATAARHALPIVFVVMNDQRFGMVELGNRSVYGRTASFPVASDALVDAARALGARAVRVDTAAELPSLAALLRSTEGPLVVDVRVDRACVMRRHKRFESLCGTPSP